MDKLEKLYKSGIDIIIHCSYKQSYASLKMTKGSKASFKEELDLLWLKIKESHPELECFGPRSCTRCTYEKRAPSKRPCSKCYTFSLFTPRPDEKN